MLTRKGMVAPLLFSALLAADLARAGTLYVGADTEDFVGGFPAGSGLDRLSVVTTNGASVIGSGIIVTDFLMNGLADAGGRLITGSPSLNTLRYVGFDGSDQGSFVAAIPSDDCCNEEMLYVPTPAGSTLFHAHWSPDDDGIAGIRELDSTNGSFIGFDPMSDVVGMALINGDIWITRWGAREVGTWDPSTNTFTVAFDLDTLGLGGLGNAGALAWDPFNQVLWLGSQGGLITPFDLTGNILGPSFQPFGPMPDTIDGLTFVGEVTVPEPGTTMLLAFALLGLAAGRRGMAKNH